MEGAVNRGARKVVAGQYATAATAGKQQKQILA
jgi:hypothetical protein